MDDLESRWLKLKKSLPLGVNLLAVSKGHPSSSIRCLAELGQRDFGESKVQEALPKIKTLSDMDGLRWHFIGHLQANKVRSVVRSFDVIHSIHSWALAERISRISGEENLCPIVMLQVKFREDPTKYGFTQKEVLEAWPKLGNLENLKIVGLMTIAPITLGLDGCQNLFRECRDFADQLGLKDCSMGMSGDWLQATQEGATWLRLGSQVFGDRPLNVNLRRDINKDS